MGFNHPTWGFLSKNYGEYILINGNIMVLVHDGIDDKLYHILGELRELLVSHPQWWTTEIQSKMVHNGDVTWFDHQK